jgi:pimeloyl-ACP methyl ester carboxylesterase
MCHVIALDAPADRVPEVAQHFGLEPVTLLAAAESAATAVQLCLQRPDVVRALIIESPTGAVDEHLARVSQPTLIVCGTRDSARWQYCQVIPRCHFIMVYDAGREPSQERPEAFAEVVGDYVQRLEAFVVQRDSGMIFP